MPRRSKHVAFLDADVLARAVTRTLLLVGAELSGYRPVWSEHVAAEADRHRRPNQVPLSRLRAFGWSDGPTGSGAERYQATDSKDRQVPPTLSPVARRSS